ncbi:hypothetical protein J4G08_21105 [Candidatus Poribacteria bacterium]|nr:hypothetical protein [Candidatus Poribacteria bacterium]
MEKTVSRTPLRISFVGGGTDIADFYRRYGGEVISTTIDKYITVEVSQREDRKIAVWTEEAKAEPGLAPSLVPSLDELQHPLIRETMRKTGVESGVSIEITSDISARGTGLGSSSALTVGLLNALYAYQGERWNAEKLARDACEVEINILGNPIGKQDQYASAYGGLRRFWFEPDDSVIVESLPQKGVGNNDRCSLLEKHLMLFDTGIQRSANTILSEQKRDASPTSLLKIRELVPRFCNALMHKDFDKVGQLLHENWRLKRGLAGSISNDQLDTTYRLALDAGALGGKVLGAGGGGYFLFYVPEAQQSTVISALDGLASHTPFRFEPYGSRLED